MTRRTHLTLTTAITMVVTVFALALAAAASRADGLGPVFRLSFPDHPRLLTTLYVTEVVGFVDEHREYDYVAKGYFKIAGETVARLPPFTGHADSTRQHIKLNVKRSTRSTIRSAARRHGKRSVSLTLVYQLTQTNRAAGDRAPETQTAKQYVDLNIPRN